MGQRYSTPGAPHPSLSIRESRGSMAASVFPPRRGGLHQDVAPVQDGGDGLLLVGPQRRPSQRVDDVVLDGGVQPVERAHSSSSTSSTPEAGRPPRSAGVSSWSARVRA